MTNRGHAPDFGRRAATYDRLRPADERWRELLDLLVREGDLDGARVLDVGCGTGRVATALGAIGVDPSPEMLEVARRRGVNGYLGRAEELPFADASFDAAVLALVVHLGDRLRAFDELRRVLRRGGRLLIATFDPTYFDAFWLNRLFPSMEAADRARFPNRDDLAAELRRARFADVRFVRLSQIDSVDRETALERIRGRHISTFDLIPEDEYAAGLAQAERELPLQFDVRTEWLVTIAT